MTRVLILRRGQDAEVAEVDLSATTARQIVGGYFETFYLRGEAVGSVDRAALYCHEDARQAGDMPSRSGLWRVTGRAFHGDSILGTFVIFRVSGEEPASLTPAQADTWRAYFDAPDRRSP